MKRVNKKVVRIENGPNDRFTLKVLWKRTVRDPKTNEMYLQEVNQYEVLATSPGDVSRKVSQIKKRFKINEVDDLRT